jgi:putative spermidine/putrescine transport system substrate-binding protein
VWATSPVPALLASQEGLTQPIPADKLANAAKLPPDLVTPEWIAWYRFFFGIAYDSSKVTKGITEWKDLWDPSLAGRVGVPSGDYAQGKFIVLLSWLGGGDETDVEPAFKLAQTLKPNAAAYFKTDSDEEKLLQSGEVNVASFMMVGNFLSLAEDPKMKFVAPKPYVPATVDVFTLLKGKNTPNAIKFLDYALSKQAQEAFAADAAVLPANKDAAAPASLAKYAPPEDQYRYVKEKAILNSLQGWADRWNREIQTH